MKSKARYLVYIVTFVYGIILGQLATHGLPFPLAVVLLLAGALVFALVGLKLLGKDS